jgi:hypothetical protein
VSRRVDAVVDLGDDAVEADLAGVDEHLAAVDLETFAELDVGAADDLLQFGLALSERQLSEVAAVQIEQVERDQDDARGFALEFVLQHREIGGAVGSGRDDLAVDDRRAGLDVPGVVRDLLEAVDPVMAAPGEDFDRLVGQMDLDPVAVEFDFVDPARPGRHLLDRRSQSGLDEAREGRLDADRRRFSTLETPLSNSNATGDSNWHGSNRSGTDDSEEEDGARAQAGPGPGGRRPGLRSSLRVQEDGALGLGGEEGRQEGRQYPQTGREAARPLSRG